MVGNMERADQRLARCCALMLPNIQAATWRSLIVRTPLQTLAELSKEGQCVAAGLLGLGRLTCLLFCSNGSAPSYEISDRLSLG